MTDVKMDLHNNKECRYKAVQDKLDFNDHFTDARKSAHELYENASDWGKLTLTSFTGRSSDYERDPE